MNYRAVKYVWNEDWIGRDAFHKELLCAKQACIADIVFDWTQDQKVKPTDAQTRLTILHVAKYATFRAVRVDKCYTKALMEVTIN